MTDWSQFKPIDNGGSTAAPPAPSGNQGSGGVDWSQFSPIGGNNAVPAAGSQQMQDQVAKIGGGGAYMTPAEVQEYANRSPLSLTPVGGWSRGLERAGQAASDLANRATNLLGLGDRIAATTDGKGATYTERLKDLQQKSAEAAARTGGAGTVADLAGTGAASAAALPEALVSGAPALTTDAAGVVTKVPAGIRYLKNIGYGALGGNITGTVGGAAQTPAGASWSDMGNNALQGMLFGTLTGAAVPAALGAPGAVLAPPANTAGQDALAAANRLGISMPNIAASDSTALQKLGQAIAGTPVGTAIPAALQKGIADTGGALENVANQIGNPASPNLIGGNMRTGLLDYIKTGSQAPIQAGEKQLEGMINPNLQVPTNDTASVLQDIADRRARALLNGQSPASAQVQNLANNPGGVVVPGLRDARTYLGQTMQSSNLPADWNGAEAKQIYKGMTNDLDTGYGLAGGPQAQQQFRFITALEKSTAANNEALNSALLGPGKSDEQLFSTVAAAAQSGGRANANLLMQVKSALPPAQWNDFSASVIGSMGKDNNGQFSPAIFLSQYSKLSDVGKNTLLTATQRSALDDLATVAKPYKALSKMANTSNTGNVNSILHMAIAPLSTLTSAFGGSAMASFMAKPAAVRSISNWSQSYGNFMAGPTMQAAKGLQSQTKNLAVTLATQLGDARQAPQIEQTLLNMNPLQTQQPVQPDDQTPQLATAP